MNADDLLPAGVALALALLTSHLLRRRSAHPRPASRYQTIDGLRGYLAFGVFLHHAAIWQMYRQGGQWMLAAPASHGYLNFGRASVALFFMITAFLFCRRVLEARSQPIDWLHLYVSRLMRLAPVYGLAMLLLFIVVGVETRWTLAVPAAELGQQVLDWLLFGFAGMPDINGLHGTALVLASVVWSLAYEWLFYLALP
ncbi:MAG: acyltransferase, partial [Burkholderiales bacterium]|nr:acyltransferase [Burkholderiales bacterium]